MNAYPNTETLIRGDYVRNVHPCNVGRMPDGVVLGGPDDLGQVSVQTGRGSHVYGPAENWTPIAGRPEWLYRAEAEETARAEAVERARAAAAIRASVERG